MRVKPRDLAYILVISAQVTQVPLSHLKLGPGNEIDKNILFCSLNPDIILCSSKIFAMTNAAGHLRGSESKCSVGAYGLGGNHVDSKHGNNTLLGDLATVVCSYDTTAGYSSNSLSSYFHDLGWRERLHTDVLHTWLGAPSIQTLGGNYGEATPSDLGFIVHNSESDVNGCAADKDPWPTVYSNTISALTATEMTRRIIQHRELPSSMQFPNVTWEDMREIMYGAETSALFPGQTWGGMTADTGIFLQSAAKIQDILANDEAVKKAGQWRIFSKLGAGYSTSRNVGEIVTNAYGCLPSYDSESGVIVGGIEFTLTARGSIAKDYDLSIVDGRVQQAVSRAVDFIYEIN